jgi:hypothetical protein
VRALPASLALLEETFGTLAGQFPVVNKVVLAYGPGITGAGEHEGSDQIQVSRTLSPKGRLFHVVLKPGLSLGGIAREVVKMKIHHEEEPSRCDNHS